MLRRIYRKIRSSLLHSLIPESKARPFARGEGIEVVGFFHSATGLGESARLCARQLAAEGYKVLCTGAEDFMFKKKNTDWTFENTARPEDIGLRIIHLNPPMIPPYAIGTGLKKFARVYNAGYWAWELEQLPKEWVRSMQYINAIMTPSSFTTATMQRYTSKPVFSVPHPVQVTTATPDIRKRLGLSDDAFMVTCIFSLQSGKERKNPQALVNAFLEAFPDTQNAYLVFKVNGIGNSKDELSALSKGHKNILFFDDIWPREDILGLIQTSNLYASLHRSEGFGLTLAEAMLLGTPVMATNWSGNVDFCNNNNRFPVDYTLVPVRSDHAEFYKAADSVWAEADIHHAATILRQIYEDPTKAQQKANYCMQQTNRQFSNPRYASVLTSLIKNPQAGADESNSSQKTRRT